MTIFKRIALIYVKLIISFRLLVINVIQRTLFQDNSSKPKKILINRDGAFGDSIVAVPSISNIRNAHPYAIIDVLNINSGGISFAQLPLKSGTIDNVYVANKKERKEIIQKLKKQSYDLFIQLPQNIGLYKSIRNMLLVRFYLNIRNAFGWDAGRVKNFMGLQKKHLSMPTETKRFNNTLNKHGITNSNKMVVESAEPNDKQILDIINTKQPYIVFLIGGKLQPKKWPLEHWKTLIKLIGENYSIIICGGENELNEANNICASFHNVINACGKLSLSELAFVLKKARVAISLDTGAMHLADIIEARQIVLFSTRDLSNKWYPNNPESIVHENVLSCSFCLKTECEDNICMKMISPEDVYTSLSQLIKSY